MDDKTAGDIFKLFTHILAEFSHRLAAMGAVCRRFVDDVFSRQMIRQGFALRLRLFLRREGDPGSLADLSAFGLNRLDQ